MRRLALAIALAALLGAILLLPIAPTATASGGGGTGGSGSGNLVGNLSGPALIATSANGTFYLNATGGPAFENGVQVGDLTWKATLSATNTTGISVTPKNGTIRAGTPQPVDLVLNAGPHGEAVTLTVEVTSTLSAKNATINLTRSTEIVVPYTVRASLIAGGSVTVQSFPVVVALDGSRVAVVTIPQIKAGATYNLTYRYPSSGLSSGYHTFTLTIQNPHGLVSFSNGRTVLSTTFYVAPAPMNNLVWYVLGFVLFVGVLFIYATRAAARRRGAARR